MRYERKYLLEHVPLFDIQQMIKLLPVGFKEAFPMRQVNNIYFDTVNFAAYRDNIMGIAQRTKFRIRWYGNDFETIQKPRLEEKVKHGELGYKNVTPLKDTVWQNITDEAALFPQILDNNLHPVLINTYHRYYYVSPNGRFRLTVDLEMKFGAFNEPRVILPNTFPEKTVIEIKYDQSDSDGADEITQALPLRPTRHSKYVNGIQACYG